MLMDLERYHFDCRLFNGYKPCHPGWVCPGCEEYDPVQRRILLIQLGSLGDVLRATAILPAIRRKYPQSHLTWLTHPSCLPLLQGQPAIDQVMPLGEGTLLTLQVQEFDVVMNLEKLAPAPALATRIAAREKYGFGLGHTGAVVPLNAAAEALFRLGVDDRFRFFENQKPLQVMFAEALQLSYQGEEYLLELSPEERAFARAYRREQGIRDETTLIGINTGCSDRIPYRRFTLEKHVELIEALLRAFPEARVALLGGREDRERNATLNQRFAGRILETPTTLGLRKGVCFVEACDVVITGDSVGLHIAIGLKKPVVAWFAPTPAQEIDLYGRGAKVLSQVTCKPCWKHLCDFDVKCNEIVEIDHLIDAVRQWLPSGSQAR